MKTRPALQLDHFGPALRISLLGWLVLVLALAAAATLAAFQHSLVREIDTLEALAARPAPIAAARTAPAVAIDANRLEDAMRRADVVALELRLPWTELFDAVEAAAGPNVALLSIEPDARRSALKVSGEARHKQAMLEYVSRLAAQRPIVRALLESHSERGGGAKPPVQFTLIAYWEVRP